jgi:hypothetical protein
MRIYPPPLNIGDFDGFTPATDIFGRSDLAGGLTNLLTRLTDPLVLAVEGPWGSGKSAFLKMWAGELRKAGFPVLYFDAFENDYADDAFTALASQLIGFVDAAKKSKTPKGKRFLKSATAASKVILRSGLRMGVKIATLNALDTKELEASAEAIAEEVGGLTDKYVGERLENHATNVKIFDAFREALADLPGLLGENGSNLPLVVMIDELDRCRPVYALDLLEKIKHFFQVEKIHFVLGVNAAQLENSVTYAYGVGIDSKTYLQKFIQISVPLVDTSTEDSGRTSFKYINHLKGVLEFKGEDRETVAFASQALEVICKEKNLSLRDIERSMAIVALACAFTSSQTLRPAPIIAGLAVMKAIDTALYRKAKSGTLTYAEVRDFLGLTTTTDVDEAPFDEKWWRFCTDKAVSADFVRSMFQGLSRYNLWGERERILPLLTNHVMDRLTLSAV